MPTVLEVIGLEHLGIVRVRGADAVKFLQGQLSNDVARLSAQRSLLAGYHNPQGRVIALLRLVQWDAEDILAVVPRELATVVAGRLSKFILRAKAKVVDESTAWRVSGLVGISPTAAGAPPTSGASPSSSASSAISAGLATSDAAGIDPSASTATGPVGTSPAAVAATVIAAASVDAANAAQGGLTARDLPSPVGAQVRNDGAVWVCVGDQPPRWLVISPTDGPSPVLDYPAGHGATWQRLDVAAGQPQVYAATSEEFVAQMLNLDSLNAIAFDKGCYTGQEVIARAHYRGRVKRRLQRFTSRDACQLSPGDSGQLADGRAFKVVLAAQLADGRCDFLAVAPLLGAVADPTAAAPVAAPITDPTMAPIAAASVTPTVASEQVAAILVADQAALPYPLPD